MKKLVVVTTFAAVALAAQSATACDWNREASTESPVVATTATTTTTTAQATPSAAPQSTSVASEQSSRRPADEASPIVLITNRQ